MLVISNPANENVASYYPTNTLEKTVPATFSEILSSTTLGRDFANSLVTTGNKENIDIIYSVEALKGLLPEKTGALEKIKMVEGLIKK